MRFIFGGGCRHCRRFRRRQRRRADLSEQTDHHHRAVRRRRAVRCVGAHHRRAHEGDARSAYCWWRTSPARPVRSAVGRAVKAAPDGYTISFGHLGTHVVNGAIYSLPYDMLTDLEPVVMLPSNPMVVVEPQHGAGQKSQGVGRLAQGQPGQGNGGNRRRRLRRCTLPRSILQSLAGLRLQFVPYRGTAPALNDLVGGQIDIIVDQASNSMQQIRSGTYPRLCDHRYEATESGAGDSDRGRSGCCRIPHDAVERAVGAEGHAEGRDRAAQCGGGGERWPIRRCRSGSTISVLRCRRAIN